MIHNQTKKYLLPLLIKENIEKIYNFFRHTLGLRSTPSYSQHLVFTILHYHHLHYITCNSFIVINYMPTQGRIYGQLPPLRFKRCIHAGIYIQYTNLAKKYVIAPSDIRKKKICPHIFQVLDMLMPTLYVLSLC